jgi:hypothetical protein
MHLSRSPLGFSFALQAEAIFSGRDSWAFWAPYGNW